ncbi:MAG: hypothetical protein Kow0042_02030 [Calditrichia bacterium]
MKILYKIVIIFLLSLLSGLIYNQFHPRGIKFHTLLPPQFYLNEAIERQIKILSVDSAFVLLTQDNVLFVDLRTPADYAVDHIRGAKYMKEGNLLDDEEMPDDSSCLVVVLYDEEGNLEKLKPVAARLIKEKKQPIYLLFGGYLEWLNKGYPVETGSEF